MNKDKQKDGKVGWGLATQALAGMETVHTASVIWRGWETHGREAANSGSSDSGTEGSENQTRETLSAELPAKEGFTDKGPPWI